MQGASFLPGSAFDPAVVVVFVVASRGLEAVVVVFAAWTFVVVVGVAGVVVVVKVDVVVVVGSLSLPAAVAVVAVVVVVVAVRLPFLPRGSSWIVELFFLSTSG